MTVGSLQIDFIFLMSDIHTTYMPMSTALPQRKKGLHECQSHLNNNLSETKILHFQPPGESETKQDNICLYHDDRQQSPRPSLHPQKAKKKEKTSHIPLSDEKHVHQPSSTCIDSIEIMSQDRFLQSKRSLTYLEERIFLKNYQDVRKDISVRVRQIFSNLPPTKKDKNQDDESMDKDQTMNSFLYRK